MEEELLSRSLTTESIIQVLRSEEKIATGYSPIIDWYYNDKTMQETIARDPFDDEDDKKNKQKIKDEYEEVKNKLEQVTVLMFLDELTKWDSPI